MLFRSQRGITRETQREFRLGLSLPGWENLVPRLRGRFSDDVLLEIENLSGAFRSEGGDLVPVLHGVSYALETGKMTAVVGESGSIPHTCSNSALSRLWLSSKISIEPMKSASRACQC